jgi:hypothetical protein
MRLLQNCFTILTTVILFQLLRSWDVGQIATSRIQGKAVVWCAEVVGAIMVVTDVVVEPEGLGPRALFPPNLRKPLQACLLR